MQKYGFRIRTKSGALVDNLVIQAVDLAHAEQKLRQMYHQASIVEAKFLDEQAGREGTDLEGAISLIVGQRD
ncbi:hypothetical protein [Chitinimonas sp.]|uniref:hypothetical protein n=1 Tax=Chitinimonas sp. TaxID=1934313 RepID=UPI0035AE893F